MPAETRFLEVGSADSKGEWCKKGERRPAPQPASGGRMQKRDEGAGRNGSGVFLRDFLSNEKRGGGRFAAPRRVPSHLAVASSRGIAPVSRSFGNKPIPEGQSRASYSKRFAGTGRKHTVSQRRPLCFERLVQDLHALLAWGETNRTTGTMLPMMHTKA